MKRVLVPLLACVLLAPACSGLQKDKKTEPEPVELTYPELATPQITAPKLEHPPVLLAGGQVLTGTGERFEPGYVLLVEGKIEHVGGERPAALPEGTQEIDTTGRVITPGLIDTHSHLGVYPSPGDRAHSDGNEATRPVTAQVSSEHSIWPQDPGFQRALAGGATTLQILPGSANLIGGRAVTVKLHPAREAAAMRFPGAPTGIKMACGENPKRVYGERGGPSTRMGSTATMRQTFQEAQQRIEAWDDHKKALEKWQSEGAKEDERPKTPKPDLLQDTLAAVLRGEILVQIHCYRADEMLLQIALAEEFGYSIRSFHHAVEAYKIREVLAEKEIAISTWADWWGFKLEAHDAIEQNIALLHLAGARPVVHSDSARGVQRLNQEAAKALYRAREQGLEVTEDDALRWITVNPAWTLGVHDMTGSLEVGKHADLVVWNGPLLSVYTLADLVFVDGVLELDRANPPEAWSDFEAGSAAPWYIAPGTEGDRP